MAIPPKSVPAIAGRNQRFVPVNLCIELPISSAKNKDLIKITAINPQQRPSKINAGNST
jgi:hypothetical protein